MNDRLLTDPEAIEQCQEAWTKLWLRTRPVPPMLEWSWVNAWWRLHRQDGQLFMVLVEDDQGQPVGLAPLYLREEGLRDPRRCLRTVHFLGTGEQEHDEVVGEYNTWLAAPEHQQLVSERVAARLTEAQGNWDRLWLQRMCPESGIAAALPALLEPLTVEAGGEQIPTFRSPVRPIDQYVQALASTSFRTRCRRALRAGKEEAAQLVRARTPAERAEMYQALRDLHQRRWIGRGQPGAFASPVFSSFQEEMFARYAESEQLWLVGLKKGDRWLAVRYLLRVGDCLYDYLSGVDTETSTALAPGLLLHLLTIDAGSREGIATYDLMCGDYDYKRKLSVVESTLQNLDIYARTIRSRLWLGAREATRRLRDARERLRGGVEPSSVDAAS